MRSPWGRGPRGVTCAFVLTEPTALSLARDLVRLEPSWRQPERVSVITAYFTRTANTPAPLPNDAATHVQLALPLGRAPSLDQHARPAPRAAGLDTILDSHLEDALERGLEPWLGSKALCDLLAVLLNAILYSTSVEARPELLPALPQRPAGERLVLSGESVFYLPDKIEISDGPVGDGATAALDGDGRPIRSIQHRVAVRGHWRRPHPQARDRRLRWIRPHFSRAPREAVLVEREYRVGDRAGTWKVAGVVSCPFPGDDDSARRCCLGPLLPRWSFFPSPSSPCFVELEPARLLRRLSPRMLERSASPWSPMTWPSSRACQACPSRTG